MSAPPAPDAGGDPRGRARADLVWYLRHAGALARWPVLAEEWARRVEEHRLADGGAGGPGARDGRRRGPDPPPRA